MITDTAYRRALVDLHIELYRLVNGRVDEMSEEQENLHIALCMEIRAQREQQQETDNATS